LHLFDFYSKIIKNLVTGNNICTFHGKIEL